MADILVFVARRTAGAVITFAAACVLVFLLLDLLPGDPAAIIAGDTATPEAAAAIRTGLGLDLPMTERFVLWMSGLLQGDLGTSFYTRTPVATLIVQRLEPTLLLAAMALLWALALALPAGMLAAWWSEERFDHGWMLFTAGAYSLPIFVAGYLLSYLFAVLLGWFPVQGFRSLESDPLAAFWHLVLPSIAAALPITALLSRVTRTSFLEVLEEDFIRTAHAKGAGGRRVLVRHAARNAAVPIITTIGSTLAILIEGVVLVEIVFSIPGIGSLTADAIRNRDYPIIQGLLVVFALFHVVMNLIVDVSYSLVDPRIRLR